jgi:hypothetical protein
MDTFGVCGGLETLKINDNLLRDLPESLSLLTSLRLLEVDSWGSCSSLDSKNTCGLCNACTLPESLKPLPLCGQRKGSQKENNDKQRLIERTGERAHTNVDAAAAAAAVAIVACLPQVKSNYLKSLPFNMGCLTALRNLRLPSNELTELPQVTLAWKNSEFTV